MNTKLDQNAATAHTTSDTTGVNSALHWVLPTLNLMQPTSENDTVVTEDDERHVIEPSTQAAAVLVSLTQASSVLLWDPQERTLIAANLVGDWLPVD